VSGPRAAIREIAAALRVLHHRLLLATQKSFEKLHGRVAGPGALLELTLHDPLFAWLRPLSQFVAELDELAASEDLTERDVEQARAEVARLIESEAEFRASYLVYLQSDPDVVVAHATLRRLLV
jgi:hypothetical protein